MNHSMDSEAQASRESLAQMLWGTGIVGFFVIQMTLWSIALYITHNDPSHKVVADYDQRTVSWDEHRRQVSASRKLGWTARIDVSPDADLRGYRTLNLVVTDDQHAPVDLDKVSLKIFHRARAAESQELEMKAVGRHAWQATARMQKSGKWQFSGTATKGEQQLLIDQQQPLTFARNR